MLMRIIFLEHLHHESLFNYKDVEVLEIVNEFKTRQDIC